MSSISEVAPDGSPVAVYLALPSAADVNRVRSVLRPRCSVLDLGAGVGRIANALAAEDHEVVAVDNSAEMLSHVVGAERVEHDIWTLDLGRCFDAVMVLSHLINHRSRARRIALLRVCRRHVSDDGVVLVQRYAPDQPLVEGVHRVGDVDVEIHDLETLGDEFSARVTYRIGDQSWSQTFDAAIVDDADLRSMAAAVGLSVVDRLDHAGEWVILAVAD